MQSGNVFVRLVEQLEFVLMCMVVVTALPVAVSGNKNGLSFLVRFVFFKGQGDLNVRELKENERYVLPFAIVWN